MDNEEQERLARQGTLVTSLLAQPQASANQLLSLLEEPFKKKRGRKPKKYYEQKALLEQTLAEQRAQQKAELNELENEEEVLQRQDEYRKHPLFSMLKQHAEELQEYIHLKKQQQALQKQKEFQQHPMHQLHGVYGTSGQGMPCLKDLFRLENDWNNAPKGYQTSDAPRAIEIKRKIRIHRLLNASRRQQV